MMRATTVRELIAVGAAAVACVAAAASCQGSGSAAATADAGVETPPSSAPDSGDCPGLSCLPCGSGHACAASGQFIDGTCCAVGDSLVDIAGGDGEEVVDVEVDGTYAYLCGGFGVRISRITDPAHPVGVASAAPRCQRIGIGELLPDGTRIFYLAHHGDTWVITPFLRAYHLHPNGSVEQVADIEDAQVSFEGLVYRKGYLYAAAHQGGLRVYSTDAAGAPTLVRTIGGFQNAWKLAADGDFAYVADQGAGIVVVSLADPASPSIVGTVPTLGQPRDVDVSGGRVFVAMGGGGVDVFDVTSPGSLSHAGNIPGPGSAQAVSAGGGLLAVAAWNHVALRDATTLRLLGFEKTRAHFEEDLGVSLVDNHLFVGEWTGLHVLEYRQGLVAPGLSMDDDVLTVPTGGPVARSVVVRNRGYLDLDVHDIAIANPSFTVDTNSLSIAPGAASFFQLSAQNPKPGLSTTVRLQSNDPDPLRSDITTSLEVAASSGIGVGDTLTSTFGFLDPSGSGQVDALRGHVTMLSYFALF